jgi:putative DeoR family transcriptional regulator (stage III sporulation protein D)
MKDYIRLRVQEFAEHIIKTGETVREVAKKYNVSKSTVHKDVSERLKKIDIKVYEKVSGILAFNLSERHIRGGISTKNKYLKGEKRGF